MSLNEAIITMPKEHVQNVFGQFDAFAKKIEKTLGVTIVLREDQLKIIGNEQNARGVISRFAEEGYESTIVDGEVAAQ